MRILIQRVKKAHVTVQDSTTGAIDRGLLLFLGIHKNDEEEKIPWFVNKIANLRIFEDDEEKMNRSVIDIEGKVLVVSQFTLYGDCMKGRRPSFTEAMAPNQAESFYESFVKQMRDQMGTQNVATGSFGASMEVHLINDGPVTFLLNS